MNASKRKVLLRFFNKLVNAVNSKKKKEKTATAAVVVKEVKNHAFYNSNII